MRGAASREVERRIGRLAARQHGVIARDQLRVLGLTNRAIDYRVERGRLITVHRGVYRAAGAVLTVPAREFAAVLACTSVDGFVSHRSAAYRLALLRYPARYRTVDVITTSMGVSSRRGVRVHRVSVLERGDTFVTDGLPITTIRRTLLDLAMVASDRELEQALAAAQRDHKLGAASLRSYLDRHRHRKGTGRLRALIDADSPPAFTRSEPEERLLTLIRAAGLPEPRTNVRIGRYEVDFVWPNAKLVVEVDGWRWHGDKAAAERDKRRDAHFAARGYRVIRVTWARLTNEPDAVVAEIAQALRALATDRVQG